MSKGKFDYQQNRIMEIAEEIQLALDRQGKPLPKEELCFTKEYYAAYPESMCYPVFSGEVLNRMVEAVKQLKIAFVYAERLDYYLSGDFLSKLCLELKNIE